MLVSFIIYAFTFDIKIVVINIFYFNIMELKLKLALNHFTNLFFNIVLLYI